MKVVIADTLATSIAKLDTPLQSLVKETVFDFTVNPEQPGFQYHRVDNAKDKNFWSIRVNRDLRIIVHRTADTNVLCYADHHDAAYRWAENRRLETHPDTGAAQMVVIDERVEEIVKRVVREVIEEPAVFARYETDYLQALGVPSEFLDAAKHVTQANLFELLDLLPQEAAERLLDLAAGRVVARPGRTEAGPFDHPDAQRRFAVVSSNDEVRLALDYPWDKWVVFLHPSQRAAVAKRYSGPAKVSGGPGTGKTVVALHRAVQLARSGRGRVLLTTFSSTLAHRLAQHLELLLPTTDPARENIVVKHLHKAARDIWVRWNKRNLKIGDERRVVDQHLAQADRAAGGAGFDLAFLRSEWEHVVVPNDIRTWDDYRSVPRAGRGVSLGAKQRKKLWDVFERTRSSLGTAGLLSWDQVCHEVAAMLERHPDDRFAHVVADEVQDFGHADLILLRALASSAADDLFLCGDPGQRIYKARSSWAVAGVHVRGRSTRLRVNYRTTEQIRDFAARLVAPTLEDGDGETLASDAVSLFSGVDPEVMCLGSTEEEVEAVAEWIRPLLAGGYKPRDIAIFARTEGVLVDRAQVVVEACGLDWAKLRDDDTLSDGCVAVGTMHRAKGLEFKAVIVMGCERGLMPLAAALRGSSDPVDIINAREHERGLLYVAATRARERLLFTGTGTLSELLQISRTGRSSHSAERL